MPEHVKQADVSSDDVTLKGTATTDTDTQASSSTTIDRIMIPSSSGFPGGAWMQFTFTEPDPTVMLTSTSKPSPSSIVRGIKDMRQPSLGTFILQAWTQLPDGTITLSLVGEKNLQQGSGIPWITLSKAPSISVEMSGSKSSAFGHKRPEGRHSSWTIDFASPGSLVTIPHAEANHRNQARTKLRAWFGRS